MLLLLAVSSESIEGPGVICHPPGYSMVIFGVWWWFVSMVV